jgi:hypothetical protein
MNWMVDGYHGGTAQESAKYPNALTGNVASIFHFEGYHHLINYIIWAHLRTLF